jgi:hypothetical protein
VTKVTKGVTVTRAGTGPSWREDQWGECPEVTLRSYFYEAMLLLWLFLALGLCDKDATLLPLTWLRQLRYNVASYPAGSDCALP